MTARRIQKLLIANRGEIAVRIARTCDAMGIATVAVFSDADAGAPFVARCGEAMRIGGAAARDSYLRIDRILEAAQRAGADSVHPGFGFLAENDAFAQAVIDAGLVWVGPTPAAIRAMGLKREAKLVARRLGVPVVPGGGAEDQSTAGIAGAARALGFPVLVKASAGGGGRGMRIVRDERELEAAIDAARREAESSFGDGTLIVERYVEAPRHVEIQVLGDTHGNLVHLFERECSIQRRHQKIVEEAPSVALDSALRPGLRERMGADAVRLCKEIGYTNAGTVEFVLAGDGAYYFLEVNTRLQVEHPVTEGVVAGLDLVEEQIRVARGEALRFDQAALSARFSGAAIECRLCAEDPDQGYLPQSGRIVDFHFDPRLAAQPWLRVEAAVERGSEVSPHYDSMIAKIIVTAEDRAEAIRRMTRALEGLSVHGIPTNRDLLLRVMRTSEYAAGEIDTGFLERHAARLVGHPPDPDRVRAAAIAGAIHEAATRPRALLPTLRSGWRNNRFAPERSSYALGEHVLEIGVVDEGRGAWLVTATGWAPGFDRVRLASCEAERIALEGSDGHLRTFRVVRDGERVFVHDGSVATALAAVPRFRDLAAEAAADGCVAPMPGKIVKVLVQKGEAVRAGQTLVVMEAMKMEHAIGSPHDGTVAELRATPGAQVDGGTLLAVVE